MLFEIDQQRIAKKSILIVDDDIFSADTAQRLFKICFNEYDVDSVYEAMDAINKCK